MAKEEWMSDKQWEYLTAEINASKLLLVSMAKAFPNQERLRALFQEQKALLETVHLNSQLPETAIAARERKIVEMELAVWG